MTTGRYVASNHARKLDQWSCQNIGRDDGVGAAFELLRVVERKLRRAAAARGLNEAVTWSFLPTADAEYFADGAQLWVLDNPISEDMKAMRPSLIPGLLSAAKRNADRGAAGRWFNVGIRLCH